MTYDLFSQDELFEPKQTHDEIVEYDIIFPLYVKNRNETRYTFFKNEKQFEEITISLHNESFRGTLMFGFNEQLHDLKYDTKTWSSTLLRVHEQITQQEYDNIFASLINGREEFFDSSIEAKYIERELNERQQNVKHKWRPAQL